MSPASFGACERNSKPEPMGVGSIHSFNKSLYTAVVGGKKTESNSH